MILVDTSIWINFFKDINSKEKETLESLIKDNSQICICGIVLQEVLQGIKEDRIFHLVESRLLAFPYIGTDLDTCLIAAACSRKLKRNGFSIPSIDVIISSLALQNNLSIFTSDKHFEIIRRYSNLKLFKPF